MGTRTHSRFTSLALRSLVLAMGIMASACSGAVQPDGSVNALGDASRPDSADTATQDAADATVLSDADPTDTSVPTDTFVPDDAPTADVVPRDVALDAPRDAAMDAPRDVAMDAPRDAPMDVPRDAPADGPRDVAIDAPVTGFCPATLPRVNVRDFGAMGDGMNDDTPAFRAAADRIQTARGGELLIPPGTYRVGGQTRRTGTTGHFWNADEILTFANLTCLHISGYGATMVLRTGLRYGAFNSAGDPIAGPVSTNDPESIDVGRMIEVSTSSNILIEGLELDGSNASLFLGGRVGDVERQGAGTGIWLNRCEDAHVRDIHAHNHALDGLAVLYRMARPPRRMPHLLERVRSEYNGRQGLSWIGGWGLEVVDSQFNHTGRVVNRGGGMFDGDLVSSRPRAGLDIEPNVGTAERSLDGHFTRCEFINNAGSGMLVPFAEGGDTTFTDCTFWGTTAPSVYVLGPGIRFVNSTFHGTGVHANTGTSPDITGRDPTLATRFEGCTFEDTPYEGRVYTDALDTMYALTAAEGDGVTWRNCTFRSRTGRTIYVAGDASEEIFENCTFDIGASALPSGSQVAYFRGSRITGCHFTEPRLTGTNRYFIDVGSSGNVTVGTPAPGQPDTVVDGPQVRWGGSTGRTGVIPPGAY